MVFHSKLFLKVPVYVSSQCWDKYRIHPHSYWRRADMEGKGEEIRHRGYLKYLKWLENYLSEEEIQDPEVWTELKQTLSKVKNWKKGVKRFIRSILRQSLPKPILIIIKTKLRYKIKIL